MSEDKERELQRNTSEFDLSVSGYHIVDLTTGESAENPLAIHDQVKADNVAVMFRMTSLWLAHCLVLGIFAASCWAQLGCQPPKAFAVPNEVLMIIFGIYGGNSWNFIGKLISAWQNRGK
jgi:hypothetical protein